MVRMEDKTKPPDSNDGGKFPEEGIMNKKVFSFDLEVDGLYGVGFAIAATVRKDGREIASFEGRIPDSAVSDDWVKKNVLPALEGMKVTHQSSEELEEAFWEFYSQQCLIKGEYGLSFDAAGVQVIAHCGSPVESGLFRRAVERDGSRTFQAPLPLHEVGTLLEVLGEDAASVDSYIEKHGIAVQFKGVSHHPMYDSVVAVQVWEHACARIRDKS